VLAEPHPFMGNFLLLQSVVSGGLDGEKKCIAVSIYCQTVFFKFLNYSIAFSRFLLDCCDMKLMDELTKKFLPSVLF